jgi:chromosome partitioning protein
MGDVVNVLNAKGGVGKTTTVYHLGVALARSGLKVCLLDFDPQGGLTQLCGVEPEGLSVTAYNVIYEGANLEHLIVPSANLGDGSWGFDLIPSNIDLQAIELRAWSLLERILGGDTSIRAESREWWRGLRILTNELQDHYDIILVDNQPTLGQLAWMSLAVADSVIIPVSADYLSVRGLRNVWELIRNFGFRTNSGLKVLGVLITMAQRTQAKESRKTAEDVVAFCRQNSIPIFEDFIPDSVKVKEAARAGKPIWDIEVSSGATAAVDVQKGYEAVAVAMYKKLVQNRRAG